MAESSTAKQESGAPVVSDGINIFLIVAILGGLGWAGKYGTDIMVGQAKKARVESLVNAQASSIPRFNEQLYALAAQPSAVTTGEGGNARPAVGVDAIFTSDAYVQSLPKIIPKRVEPPKPTPAPFAQLVLPPVDIESPPVDFSALIGDKIRPDGVIDNGAFVNGRFYGFGDELRLETVEAAGEDFKAVLLENYREGKERGIVVNVMTSKGHRHLRYPLRSR